MKTPLGTDVEVSPGHTNNPPRPNWGAEPCLEYYTIVLKEGKIRLYICICEYVYKETLEGKTKINRINFWINFWIELIFN